MTFGSSLQTYLNIHLRATQQFSYLWSFGTQLAQIYWEYDLSSFIYSFIYFFFLFSLTISGPACWYRLLKDWLGEFKPVLPGSPTPSVNEERRPLPATNLLSAFCLKEKNYSICFIQQLLYSAVNLCWVCHMWWLTFCPLILNRLFVCVP